MNLNPLPVSRWETPHPLSLLPLRTAAPSGAEGGVYGSSRLSTALLQVYKRLRSQVRGSQSRRRRCLRSELKVVWVPCIFEHNLKSYTMFQLCEDVFCLQIKRTGNGPAHTGDDGCVLQCSQAHTDYYARGPYCLKVAQIDYCLGLRRIDVYVLFLQERCFPT